MEQGVEKQTRKPALSEDRLVRRWRRGQFLSLGFSPREADTLAKAPVDLAVVRGLVSSGCPLETARRIVL